jgi:hypothetical protein
MVAIFIERKFVTYFKEGGKREGHIYMLKNYDTTFNKITNWLVKSFFIWFVRLLALRPRLAYCASLG